MKKILLLTVFLSSIFLVQAQMRYLKGTLTGTQEVPPVSTAAGGVVIVNYNTVTNSLQLHGNYRGLTTDISAAHIHGPAAPGNNADPIFNLTFPGGTTGPLSLSTTISEAQEADLLGGLWYVNVHSTTFPGGEIRAQLTTTTEGQTSFFNARLQGSQEVPPRTTTATGTSYILLDRVTNTLYLTGSYAGLTAAVVGSHIHTGNPGENGDIMVHLVNSGGTTGTLHLEAPVTEVQKNDILVGGTYVNVHSGTYTGGEIRGQITNYSQLTFFGGSLTGDQEVPAVNTTAKGTVIVRYNSENRQLELVGDYQGLTTGISAAHIHGPAAPGNNADPIFNLTFPGGTTGPLSLSTTISEAQEADLLGGLWYVNVHSTTFPGGEIRAQLMPTSSTRTHYFTGILQGSQEVPAPVVPTSGTGNVTAILDIDTRQVYLTGTFSGLTSNATMAHIHQAPPGTPGGIIVTLSVPVATSGTVTGSGTITPAQVSAMINGNTYVNIHSVNNGPGELRAQLGNLVLPIKLISFNGLKEREGIVLAWTSAQENNLLSYDVEQQDPATKTWIKKGTVIAKGQSGNTQYSFRDVPIAGRSAVILYRLKMTETDGKVSYSNVIRVNFKTGKGELTLLANPVRNGVLRFVVTGLPATEKAEATVMDYNGRVVVKTLTTLTGTTEINIGQLAAGMYRLVITAGGEVMQQSFVK